jgi:hypothetical protein
MSLTLLLLAACANQVTITPSQGYCTDFDYADPPDSSLEVEVSADGTARVWRANAVLDQTGLLFDPEITVDGNIVSVYEGWSGGDEETAFCYEPAIGLDGLTKKIQVRWFMDDTATVPFDTIDVEP